MRLEIISPFGHSASIRRTVAFNRKSGRISFSNGAMEAMGLRPGLKLVMARDADTRHGWYFTVMPEAELGVSISAKKYSKKDGTDAFASAGGTSRTLCKALLDALKINSMSASFLMEGKPTEADGVKWWRVITENKLNNEKR